MAAGDHSKALTAYQEAGSAAAGTVSQHAAALHLLHDPEQAAGLLQLALGAIMLKQPPGQDNGSKAAKRPAATSSIISSGRCWQAAMACNWLEAENLDKAVQAASDMPHRCRYGHFPSITGASWTWL